MYINPPGGRELYNQASFTDAAIDLRFLESSASPYTQRSGGFVPGLSIVDVLMETGIARTRVMLDDFELGKAAH